jgi:hypothetical protein
MGKIKDKTWEWTKRYGPAELASMATAYLGFFLARDLESEVASAYSATMLSNVGFYGTMIVQDVVRDSKVAREAGEEYGIKGATKTGLKLVGEFGLGEFLDSTLIRPVLIGGGVRAFGKNIGVGVGTIAANISFYLPTILSYETIKHFTRGEDKQES